MAVFSVATIYSDNQATLRAKIIEHFPGEYYQVSPDQWLISFGGTAKELFVRLFPEIPDPPQPPFPITGIVVFGVGGYYGLAPRDMWEWVATKLGERLAKGKDQRGPGGEQTGTPRYPETTPPNLVSGDPSSTLELIMHMQLAIGKLTEAVDGLKSKQSEQSKKLDRISHQVYAAIVVLVVIGAILTFFAKSINDVITHRLLTSTPQQQQVAPAPPQQNPQKTP